MNFMYSSHHTCLFSKANCRILTIVTSEEKNPGHTLFLFSYNCIITFFFNCIVDKKQNSPFEANCGGRLIFQNLLVQSFQAITTYNQRQSFVCNAFKYLLGVRKLNKPDWTPMMEQALNVIYFLAEHPETIAESILQKMATCLLEKSDNNTDTEDSPKSCETDKGKNSTKKKFNSSAMSKPEVVPFTRNKTRFISTTTPTSKEVLDDFDFTLFSLQLLMILPYTKIIAPIT